MALGLSQKFQTFFLHRTIKSEQFLLDSIYSSSSTSSSPSSSRETFNPIKKGEEKFMGTEYIYFVAMPLNEPIVHFTQTRFNGISKSFCLPFISLPIFSLFLSFWVKRLYALLLFPIFVFFLIFDSFFLFLFVLLLSHINTNNINMTIR